MVSQDLLDLAIDEARAHCAKRGYVSGPNWNPLEPHDPVAAFAMARRLVASRAFDHYIAVAPEGHAYGYFFELLGVRVGSVFVDYPPRAVSGAESMREIAGGRVLLIEDDVVSGVTLEMVVSALLPHQPASIAIYLGRRADDQIPEKVPAAVRSVFLAEAHLDPSDRPQQEAEFANYFSGKSGSVRNGKAP